MSGHKIAITSSVYGILMVLVAPIVEDVQQVQITVTMVTAVQRVLFEALRGLMKTKYFKALIILCSKTSFKVSKTQHINYQLHTSSSHLFLMAY